MSNTPKWQKATEYQELLECHYKRLKEVFPDNHAYVGWSQDDGYICSKIYKTERPTYFVSERHSNGAISHQVDHQ